MSDKAAGDVELDLSECRDLLMAAVAELQRLHGTKVPAAARGRERGPTIADVQKGLLFLGHLCDKARISALDEYHTVRGHTAHHVGYDN